MPEKPLPSDPITQDVQKYVQASAAREYRLSPEDKQDVTQEVLCRFLEQWAATQREFTQQHFRYSGDDKSIEGKLDGHKVRFLAKLVRQVIDEYVYRNKRFKKRSVTIDLATIVDRRWLLMLEEVSVQIDLTAASMVFTEFDRRVFELARQGRSQQEIAEWLSVSKATVSRHLQLITAVLAEVLRTYGREAR